MKGMMRLANINTYMANRSGQGTPHNIGADIRIKEAMQHPNKLGAGVKKRHKVFGKHPKTKKAKQEKAGVVMKEFYKGTLHSGSGEIVTNVAQAKAIAMSEAGLSKKKKKS